MRVDAAQSETERSRTGMHHAAVSHAGVFRVLDDGDSQLMRSLQSVVHNIVSQNGPTVISHCHSTGFDQLLVVGELFAVAANGCSSDRTNLHARAPLRRLHPSCDLG